MLEIITRKGKFDLLGSFTKYEAVSAVQGENLKLIKVIIFSYRKIICFQLIYG